VTRAARSGGETLIGHERHLFCNHFARAAAGRDFYDAIEPKFNRLIVFDDRLPHAVERVDGSMDPAEGRIVLHGHLGEGGTIVEGALSADLIHGLLQALLQRLTDELSGEAALYHASGSGAHRVGATSHESPGRVHAVAIPTR
jgi:hypothetical protein